MSQRIDILPSSAYIRHLGAASEGKQAFTHAALLRVDGKLRRYYIKSYHNAEKPLFNEIAGFLMASEAGIPQAAGAAIMALPGDFLNSIHPAAGFTQQDQWLCWGTTALTAGDGATLPSATNYFKGDLDAIADDLRTWKHLPGLLAFDEWVANVDRNTGNLIRLSAANYAVIDHGAILSGPDWVADMLAPAASYANKIWSLLRPYRGEVPLPVSSGAVLAANGFSQAYLRGSPEMCAFGRELLNDDDLRHCDLFLRERSLVVKRYLQRRVGVLL